MEDRVTAEGAGTRVGAGLWDVAPPCSPFGAGSKGSGSAESDWGSGTGGTEGS